MGNLATKTLAVSGYATISLALATIVVRREKTLFAKPLLAHSSSMAFLALEVATRRDDGSETNVSRIAGMAGAAATFASGIVLLFSMREMITIPSVASDGLTDLPNRLSFMKALERTLRKRRSGKTAHNSTVIFVDLDNFKKVNDLFGHACGDVVLIEVGRRLRALAPTPHVAARIAGDEFAVLVADVRSETTVASTIVRIRKSLAEPFLLDGSLVNIGASVGSAIVDGTREATAVMRCADEAMYVDKHRSVERQAR